MNNDQKNNFMKVSKEIKRSQKINYIYNNKSNINIQHRSRIRNEMSLNNNETDKEIEHNIYTYEPIYQTIKPENIVNNTHNQPQINYVEQRVEHIENRYLERQNTVSCLKPLSSYTGKIVKYHNANSTYNDRKDSKKLKAKIAYQFHTDNKNHNIIKNNLTNSYLHIYSNKYSPHKIPDEYLIQNEMLERDYPYLNKKIYSNKNTVKKVKVINDNEKRDDDKKNHLETKINNTSQNYSLKIITNSTEKANNKTIKKKK